MPRRPISMTASTSEEGPAMRYSLSRATRQPGRQRAGDRRLFGDVEIGDLAGQWHEPAALHPRLIEQLAQIEAGALAAVMLGEHRIAQRRIDAIGFERGVVLQINRLGIAAQ